jgi:hypothetical protein
MTTNQPILLSKFGTPHKSGKAWSWSQSSPANTGFSCPEAYGGTCALHTCVLAPQHPWVPAFFALVVQITHCMCLRCCNSYFAQARVPFEASPQSEILTCWVAQAPRGKHVRTVLVVPGYFLPWARFNAFQIVKSWSWRILRRAWWRSQSGDWALPYLYIECKY